MKSRINANIYGIFCRYYFSKLYISGLIGVLGHETLHYVNDDGTGGISEEDAQEGQNIYNSNENMSEEELKAELIAKGKTPEEAEKIAGEIFEDIRAHTFDTKIWTSLKSQYMIANQEMDTKAYLLQEGQDVFNQYVGSEYVLGQDKSGKLLEYIKKLDEAKAKLMYKSKILSKETCLKLLEVTSKENTYLKNLLQGEIHLGKGFLAEKENFKALYKLLKTDVGNNLYNNMLASVISQIMNGMELVREDSGRIKGAKIAVNEDLQLSDLTSGDENKYFFVTSEFYNEESNKGYIMSNKFKMNYTRNSAQVFSVNQLSEVTGANKEEIFKKLDYTSSKIQNYYQNPEDLVKQVEEKYKRMQEEVRKSGKDSEYSQAWKGKLKDYIGYDTALCNLNVANMLAYIGIDDFIGEGSAHPPMKNATDRANEMTDTIKGSDEFSKFFDLPEVKALREKYYKQDKDGNWVMRSDEEIAKILGIAEEELNDLNVSIKELVKDALTAGFTNILKDYREQGFMGVLGMQRHNYTYSGHVTMVSGDKSYDINYRPNEGYDGVPMWLSLGTQAHYPEFMADLILDGESDIRSGKFDNMNIYYTNSSIALTMSTDNMVECALEEYDLEQEEEENE